MRQLPCFLLAALLFPACAAWATQPSWELRDDGQWPQVAAPTTAPVADARLDRVEEMIRNKQYEPAKRMVVGWLKSNPSSPIRDRGLYLLGQANYHYGNRINSFYNFDELMDRYPESRYFYPALERQYEIADAFLKGYKRRFLGIPFFEAKTEATEMLYRIQQRAPGSSLAEKSLLRVADHYYSSAEFELSADAYAAYVRSYPRSPYLARVRLRQAFSALAQFRGVRFDATPIIDARQQLLDLSIAYPQIAEEENVPSLIQRIDAALAKKMLVTAEFFGRTNKEKAAEYYYQWLIRTYPQSPEAQTAQARLGSNRERR